VIVTDIVLADDISDGYNSYDDDEDEGDEYEGEECNNFHEEKIQVGDVCTDEEDGEEEDEYEYEETKGSAFSAFGVFSDDSTSSSSSSDEDSDDTANLDEGGDEECCDVPSSTYNFEEDAAACVEDCVEEDCDDDDLDLLEDIIYQNRLQARFYPDDDDDDAGNETKPSAIALAPIAFDDEHYDPDNFDVDRLAAIQHRLQKRYGLIYCCLWPFSSIVLFSDVQLYLFSFFSFQKDWLTGEFSRVKSSQVVDQQMLYPWGKHFYRK